MINLLSAPQKKKKVLSHIPIVNYDVIDVKSYIDIIRLNLIFMPKVFLLTFYSREKINSHEYYIIFIFARFIMFTRILQKVH